MEYIDKFKQYLNDNYKSQKTIESYSSDVKQFICFTKKDINGLTTQDINKFKEQLKNKDFSIKTINRKLVSINQFIIYLNECEKFNIKVKIRQEKIAIQDFIDDMMEKNDVDRILRAAQRENDVRAKALIYTLFLTGARVSEMLQIKIHDINKDTIEVRGKGAKYRKLLIPKKLASVWNEYANVRYNNTEYLFSGERGPINRQTVHNTIKNYTGKARGIDKDKCHAHAFRHLYAKSLSDLGVNAVIISQLLGHKLNITGIYIQKSKKDLLKIINKL
jgi:integrase/recombinase XerD